MDDRSSWPWIAGRAGLIDRLADRHHEAHYEMAESMAIYGSRPGREGASWRELLDAGYRALEVTGREIAAARDQDTAAAARLKYEAYERTLSESCSALLNEAHRKLQHHPETGDWLVGYGRRTPEGPCEIIRPANWIAGTPDWQRWRLEVDGRIAFYDIRLLDLWADPAVFDAVLADLDGGQTPESKKTVAAGTACRQWLTEKFKAERDCRKGDLRAAADQQFPGLSDKAFDRAVAEAKAADTTHPSWHKSGPPRSS
jgi:hypothetical protein